MPDLTGGQLTIAGNSGDFLIVDDNWFPEEEALTSLWFGNNLETEDTKVGPGDWVLNQTSWAPTPVQIPMWFMGATAQGFRDNIATWKAEILGPGPVARLATLTDPDGMATATTYVKKLELIGRGKRTPSGWPLMFEFLIPIAPFT